MNVANWLDDEDKQVTPQFLGAVMRIHRWMLSIGMKPKDADRWREIADDARALACTLVDTKDVERAMAHAQWMVQYSPDQYVETLVMNGIHKSLEDAKVRCRDALFTYLNNPNKSSWSAMCDAQIAVAALRFEIAMDNDQPKRADLALRALNEWRLQGTRPHPAFQATNLPERM